MTRVEQLERRGPLGLRRADRFVRGAATKAWAALLERRLPLSPVWWVKALSLHWQETRGADGPPSGPQALNRSRLEESYQRWLKSYSVTTHVPGRAAPAGELAAAADPSVSIVALVDEQSPLAQIVGSVQSQSLQNWELWLVSADDSQRSSAWAFSEHTRDPRISVVSIGDLTRADGTWVPPGRGQYLVLLGPDTWLAPEALSKVAPAMADRAADWIYTDDDRLDEDGRRSDPNLKGVFSPELALADDYATRLAVARRGVVEDAGGLQSECREAQVYDLFLRIAARGGPIRHVAQIGCHRRDKVGSVLGPHHRAAAQRMLARRGVPALITVGRRSSPSAFDLQDIDWPRDILARQHVTVVIPTRDRVDLLQRCIESLRRTVDRGRTSVLIVDDHSQEEATQGYLATLAGDRELRCRVIRPARTDERFNYARLMNAGARAVGTELMLHLNDDVEAVAPGWIDQMAGWLAFDDIGVVGAKLIYQDGSIQHAGVVVSPSHGAPGHLFSRLTGNDMGYQWLPHKVRNVSAVTGACLLTRTALFHELGGFDEQHLAVQFNDTDYCLRAIGAGKRVVYEPSAVLFHSESASRGQHYDYRETLFFLEKYCDYQEPFASPRLEVTSLYGPTPLVVA